MLLRFYEPQNGAIFIDGLAINELSKHELRNSFSLVPQDPVIFAMTALENIRFSRPHASETEVREAAVAADAHKFITKL